MKPVPFGNEQQDHWNAGGSWEVAVKGSTSSPAIHELTREPALAVREIVALRFAQVAVSTVLVAELLLTAWVIAWVV